MTEERSTVMVYRHPGKHEMHGDNFDYKIIDAENLDKHLADKWFKTTDEAKENTRMKGRPKRKPKQDLEKLQAAKRAEAAAEQEAAEEGAPVDELDEASDN